MEVKSFSRATGKEYNQTTTPNNKILFFRPLNLHPKKQKRKALSIKCCWLISPAGWPLWKSYFLLKKTAWFGGCSDSDSQKPSLYLLGPFRKLLEEAHGDESPGHPPRGDFWWRTKKNSSYEPQWCHDFHICWNVKKPQFNILVLDKIWYAKIHP